MNDRAIILILFAGFGLLAVLLALPLINRRIPPNGWYGFRVPATLRDPALWYEINARFGKWLLASGVLFIFAALGLYRTSLSLDNYAWAGLTAFSLPFLVGIIVAVRDLRASGSARS